MAEMILRPVVSPVLVGREGQLAALDAALATLTATAGGSVVLIHGEAGIGKSRLVAEAVARAERLGGRTLRGLCFETDRALPYAPFVDLLAGALTEPDSAVHERQPQPLRDSLASLPELAVLLPHAGVAPASASGAGELSSRRIGEALARWLLELAKRGPLLVALEDLHWSDDASLECVQLLARRCAAAPILLLLTWRSDESHASLRQCLAALDRGRRAVELPLQGLSRAETERMVRAIFEQTQPIRAEFLEAIVSLTDGNPFFIEEVLTGLIAAGDIYRTPAGWARRELAELRIPRSVRDAVELRTRRLSPPARRVLEIAAVAGQRFDVAIVRALSGLDEAALLASAQELVAALLVVDASAEQLAFRHALTREVIYAEVLTLRRRELHRAIAWTIEELYAPVDDAQLADLAYHAHEAGDWERTFTYARRAAERAEALFSPRAVVTQTTRAISAAEHLRRPVPANLYRQRGLAAALLGQFDVAREQVELALRQARVAGDANAEWQALYDLGGIWLGLDYARAGDYLPQAEQLARGLGDQRLIARSLIQLANWHINTEQLAPARQLLEEALALFEQVADRPGVALATDLLGIVADIGCDVATMQRQLLRAIDLYRELDDRQGLASALATVVSCAGGAIFDTAFVPATLSHAAAQAYGEQALALARDIDWRAGEAYALINLGLNLVQHGELGRAAALAAEALPLAEEIEHLEWLSCACYLHGQLGLITLEYHAARDWFQRGYSLGRAAGSPHFAHMGAAGSARCSIALGELHEADRTLASIDPDLPWETVGQRAVWLARGHLAVAAGRSDEALAMAHRMLTTAVGATREADVPHVALLRAAALTALGRLSEADAAVRAAEQGALRIGERPLLWSVCLAATGLAAARQLPSAARQARNAAHAVLTQLVESLPDAHQREQWRQRAEAQLNATQATSQAPETSPLTRREREVAQLVAGGLTNREIAAQLFVGERTIETHVSNSLAKLSFTSRAQLAAWIASKHL